VASLASVAKLGVPESEDDDEDGIDGAELDELVGASTAGNRIDI